jgi:putative sterol carrier protein
MSQALTEAFAKMQQRFKPGVAPKDTTIYFSLGDAPDQKWVMKLGPTACTVSQGKSDSADVVLKTSEELFLKLITGQWVPGAMDFMRGKIKSNDPQGLTLLKDCFI